MIGGNLSGASEGIVIDITFLGEVEEGRMLRRSGARPGDAVLVTGAVGASTVGRLALERGLDRARPDVAYVVAAHLTPTPRVREGAVIAASRRATAMIDVSDGLAGDIGHICEASNAGVRLFAGRVPMNPQTVAVAQGLGIDPLHAALHGGEDYELLFTCPPEDAEAVSQEVRKETGTPVTEIGVMTEGPQRTLALPDGGEQQLTAGGWGPFCRGEREELTVEVVDAHQHLGSLSNAMGHYGGREVEVSLEDDSRTRAEGLEAVGIDWAVIQPSHGYLKPEGIKDTMRLNDSMAQYRKLSPTRFPVVLGTVEPMHGERSLEEVDRAKSELGLNGLSWHHRFSGLLHRQQVDAPDPEPHGRSQARAVYPHERRVRHGGAVAAAAARPGVPRHDLPGHGRLLHFGEEPGGTEHGPAYPQHYLGLRRRFGARLHRGLGSQERLRERHLQRRLDLRRQARKAPSAA